VKCSAPPPSLPRWDRTQANEANKSPEHLPAFQWVDRISPPVRLGIDTQRPQLVHSDCVHLPEPSAEPVRAGTVPRGPSLPLGSGKQTNGGDESRPKPSRQHSSAPIRLQILLIRYQKAFESLALFRGKIQMAAKRRKSRKKMKRRICQGNDEAIPLPFVPLTLRTKAFPEPRAEPVRAGTVPAGPSLPLLLTMRKTATMAAICRPR
jgi:hypothetical protein